ncbi:MFS transporter [Sphingomonas deserti]|uniref:MFS transporter n=2 Tax=Allosphingosinicella deserti TaxID=2116704 RepID=A0A2P7QSR5_9SPHN|nr:MFS transporter [Sphingomonas deserti]
MCCGLFGVQVVWGLQNVNTSRILQTLGAKVDELPILWIAAPITGLLVQPVIGYLSDHSWGRLGRRRPYIVAGAVLTAAALIAMPNAESLFAATFILWLLTASINVAMEPFRALVADTLPQEQRTSGFAAQVFFIGLGAVFAAALPWVLSHWFGVSGQAEAGRLPPSVHMSFAIGAAALLAAVGWSVLTTSERPPECLEADPLFDTEHPVPTSTGAAILARSGGLWLAGGCVLGFAAVRQEWGRELQLVAGIAIAFGVLQVAAVLLRRAGHSSIGMIEIVEDILHMPVVLRRLALVQFFTWFGMFALWVYAIPAVAAHHYGTSDPASPAFGESADWVGILFAEYNAVSALVALALPSLVARIGRRAAHSLALLLGASGFVGFVLIDAPGLLWLPAIGIGCAWASILSLPYAMLADAVPPRKMGVYMGVHNIFLVLPQLVAAALLGFLVRAVFSGEAILALALAAGSLATAAALTFTIPPQGELPTR